MTTRFPTQFRLAWLLLIPFWGALAIATHLPGESIVSLGKGDKLVHFLAFLGLSFLLAWSIPRRKRNRTVYVGIFVMAALYGAFDEWTQAFVPGRSSEIWDWFADVSGATTGLIAFVVFQAVAVRARSTSE